MRTGCADSLLRDEVRRLLEKTNPRWRYVGRRKSGLVNEFADVMRSKSSLLVHVAIRPSCFDAMEGGRQLALDAIGECHNLKALMLCDFSEDDLLQVLSDRALFEKLTHLELCGGILTVKCARKLRSAPFARLRSLLLSRCHVESEG